MSIDVNSIIPIVLLFVDGLIFGGRCKERNHFGHLDYSRTGSGRSGGSNNTIHHHCGHLDTHCQHLHVSGFAHRRHILRHANLLDRRIRNRPLERIIRIIHILCNGFASSDRCVIQSQT